jgi:hypothetical protein
MLWSPVGGLRLGGLTGRTLTTKTNNTRQRSTIERGHNNSTPRLQRKTMTTETQSHQNTPQKHQCHLISYHHDVNPFNGIERVLVARLISYLEPCEGCLWSSELFRLRGMCIWGLRCAMKSLSSRKLILHGVRREVKSL